MESISNINNSLNRLEPKPKERTTDVELSQDILDLIDNKLFINRYRGHKKEYGEEFLQTVAKMAKETGKMPSRLFAAMCSKKNIDRTLETVNTYLAKAKAVAKVVLQRPTVFVGRIYRNFKNISAGQIESMLKRSSDAENPSKNFNWLLSDYLKSNGLT